jgi:hypothetical protein
VTNKIAKAYLLTQPESSLKLAAGDAGMTLSLPGEMPDRDATVIVLEIDGPPRVFEPPKTGG